jgi:hypothetical protein
MNKNSRKATPDNFRNQSGKLAWILSAIFPLFIFAVGSFNKVSAQCINQVPTPLDPDCTGTQPTVGNLINRFVQVVPFVVTFLAIIAIVRAAIKIINSADAEQRNEGFKALLNAAIGLVLFFSIWIILYLIEQFTGGELITFGFDNP